MPTQDAQWPIRFMTSDGLVIFSFTFTVSWNPSRPGRDPVVSADIALLWEVSSPPDPITAEIRLRQPAQLAHVSDNGFTLAGTLSLHPMPSGRIAIFADVQYGDRDDRHIDGVLGIFSLELD
jgi:hypothetical protein